MTVEIATLFLMLVILIVMFVFAKNLRESIQDVKEVNAEKMQLLNRLERTVDRMEEASSIFATNLASSIDRADNADDAIPGASADAAYEPRKVR